MSKPERALQPNYFDQFRCIGADCEDTCCEGWGILIDQETYEKYRNFPDSPMKETLAGLVAINPRSIGARDYAKIQLTETRCPAMANGLCSIQRKLGEEYLSEMCAIFPRVRNAVDGRLESSLHLSCPEAARLVLLNPTSMVLREMEIDQTPARPSTISRIDASCIAGLHTIRRAMVAILDDVSMSLGQRLAALGYAVYQLDDDATSHAFLEAMESGVETARQLSPAPDNGAGRLEAVLELILARISSQFTARRFLECYSEFMQGINWTAESSMDDLIARYRVVHNRHYAPFLRGREYILRNYLVNYIFRTLFPFGRKRADQTLAIERRQDNFRAQHMLLIVHFAIIKTILVGISGFHRDAFGAGQIVKVVQAATKVFQHDSSFPSIAMKVLASKGLNSADGLALLAAD